MTSFMMILLSVACSQSFGPLGDGANLVQNEVTVNLLLSDIVGN